MEDLALTFSIAHQVRETWLKIITPRRAIQYLLIVKHQKAIITIVLLKLQIIPEINYYSGVSIERIILTFFAVLYQRRCTILTRQGLYYSRKVSDLRMTSTSYMTKRILLFS